MNIEDLLNLLTPEQLEQLADLKRKETQDSDTILEPQKESKRKQVRKPKKKPIEKITGENHPKIPKRKNTRRTQFSLGKRDNLFEKSTEKNLFKEDAEIDKKLFSGRITERTQRKLEYIDAKCSQCEVMYEDVPITECYKDDTGFVFICEECVGKLNK